MFPDTLLPPLGRSVRVDRLAPRGTRRPLDVADAGRVQEPGDAGQRDGNMGRDRPECAPSRRPARRKGGAGRVIIEAHVLGDNMSDVGIPVCDTRLVPRRAHVVN